MTQLAPETEEPQVPSWLKASLADIELLEFEHVIAGSKAADSGELADLYRLASQEARSGADGSNDSARIRVWDLLYSVTEMHFKPADTNEPFGPMLVLADGRRSATAADFRDHVEILRSLAMAATNVVLRARLSDLVWLLERKQALIGVEALKAYVEIVRRIEAGELKFRHGSDAWSFHPDTRDYLLRALGIARLVQAGGRDRAGSAHSCSQASRGRQGPGAGPLVLRAGSTNAGVRPLDIAAEIEEVLTSLPEKVDYHIAVELWRLASRAYQAGKKDEDKQRCQLAAAEMMVVEAEKIASPMLASHLLAAAIAELHGIASARQRRLELRHRLVEVQANVSEEMGAFSQRMDLSEYVKAIQEELRPLSVYDSLFVFASVVQSPDPEKLRAEAIEQICKHPFSSLFGAAHLDDEGKVIHRTGGGGFGQPDEPVIAAQIALADGIRRHISVSGQIDPARLTIITGHYLSDDILYALTSNSPFVPQDLGQTFARGFSRFLQGDFTSALYTLTPLLENSLRYLLKQHGHDVTTFDNAHQTQEDRTITSLYDGMRVQLDAILTRAITDDIERVFLGRPGPAIRHGVAHGLLHDGSPYGVDAIYACWLIFRLCVLPLYPHRQELGLE